MASLQLLSRLRVHSTLSKRDQVHWLPLPCRIQNLIGTLFASTIRVRGGEYMHCTEANYRSFYTAGFAVSEFRRRQS